MMPPGENSPQQPGVGEPLPVLPIAPDRLAPEPVVSAEAAVSAAMASTEGTSASFAPEPPTPRTLRPVGRHMLGLLEAPEATEPQRLGARIILMNGTTIERELLFLHDAMWIAGRSARQPMGAEPAVSLAKTAAQVMPELGSLQALAQTKDMGRATRRLHDRIYRGDEPSEAVFQEAVAEVRDKLLPNLHPDDVVALLRMQRHMPAQLASFGSHSGATKTMEVLVEKGNQLDQGASEGRAIVAEAVMGAAGEVERAADQLAFRGGFLRERAARKLDRAAAQARADSFDLLSPQMRALCTGHNAAIDPLRLGTAIDAQEVGLSYQGLSGILWAEPDFLAARRFVGVHGDIAVLNKVGEMMYSQGPLPALIAEVRGGWMLSEKTHELRVATELAEHPALAGIFANPTAGSHLVHLLKGYDAGERERTLGLLESMQDVYQLDAVVLGVATVDQLEAFKAILTAPDGQTFQQLHALMSIPHFARALLHRPQGAYRNIGLPRLLNPDVAAARSDLLEMFDGVPLGNLRNGPLAYDIIQHYVRDALALHWAGPGGGTEFSRDEYMAKARRFGELLADHGASEALDMLQHRSPAIAQAVIEEVLYGNNEDLATRVQSLKALAGLDLSKMTTDEVYRIRRIIGTEGDLLRGLSDYGSLGLGQFIGANGILNSHADAIAGWVFDPATGDATAKRALLRSSAMRDFTARANKDGHHIYTAGLVAQIARGKTIEDIQAYMAECVRLAADPQISGAIYDLGLASSLSSGVLWTGILQAESPSAAVDLLNDLADRDADFWRDLAARDTDGLLQGVLNRYLSAEEPERYAGEWRTILANMHVLDFVSTQGIHYPLRQQILMPILTSPYPLAAAQRFERQLVGDRPQWLVNYEVSRLLVTAEGHQEGMIIHEIPTGLPIGSRRLSSERIDSLLEGELMRPIAEMSLEEKRLFLGTSYSDDELAGMEAINFTDIDPDARQTLLIYRMFETVERSRSQRMRETATTRNMAAVWGGEPVWQAGDLVHFTELSNMRGIMVSGNLARELASYDASADKYPFNVDFWRVGPGELMLDSDQARYDSLPTTTYGSVAIHYRRKPGGYRAGEEFSSGDAHFRHDHFLMFAGMPSTEISAVTVAERPDAERLSRLSVESGIYIPIYDTAGQLQFTPDAYREARADRNYDAVELSIVDAAFVAEDTRRGGNDGGEVYIPGPDRRPERWYAKFADDAHEDAADRLWNEVLTDSIYAAVRPELVPETRVVLVNGRMARISRMVEPSGEVTNQARNAGFVLDCLTANWDAVYNVDNLVQVGDRALRVDTGGGLDFSPKQGKKDPDYFTDEVRELRMGDEDTRLGNGMRQKYPDLTDDDIRAQARELQERLTDDVIDARVDGVRRTRADREMIKRTLKGRRDYIIAYAAQL